MMLGAPFGYPLGYSINMFIGLELENYFSKREGSLVEVSLETLNGLMIGTGEVSFLGV